MKPILTLRPLIFLPPLDDRSHDITVFFQLRLLVHLVQILQVL